MKYLTIIKSVVVLLIIIFLFIGLSKILDYYENKQLEEIKLVEPSNYYSGYISCVQNFFIWFNRNTGKLIQPCILYYDSPFPYGLCSDNTTSAEDCVCHNFLGDLNP